ncbi:MAG: hypothetical protein Q8T08_20255 [Ignavibacteria bacterium]|nr:hypothetical protein [Ignavibacteria bacterium]
MRRTIMILIIILMPLAFFGCNSTGYNAVNNNSNLSAIQPIEPIKPIESTSNKSNSSTSIGYNDVSLSFSFNDSGNGSVNYVINGNIASGEKVSATVMVNISCNYKYSVGNSGSVFNGFINQSAFVYFNNQQSFSSQGSLYLSSTATGISCTYSKVSVN